MTYCMYQYFITHSLWDANCLYKVFKLYNNDRKKILNLDMHMETKKVLVHTVGHGRNVL
jgi:hypothetical protein